MRRVAQSLQQKTKLTVQNFCNYTKGVSINDNKTSYEQKNRYKIKIFTHKNRHVYNSNLIRPLTATIFLFLLLFSLTCFCPFNKVPCLILYDCSIEMQTIELICTPGLKVAVMQLFVGCHHRKTRSRRLLVVRLSGAAARLATRLTRGD